MHENYFELLESCYGSYTCLQLLLSLTCLPLFGTLYPRTIQGEQILRNMFPSFSSAEENLDRNISGIKETGQHSQSA